MNLKGYFEFHAPNDIRIKGTRIGIETVLYDYIHRGRTAEQIARDYPLLLAQQVHATILYYLENKKEIDKYLEDWLEFGRKKRREQAKDASFVRLRKKLRAFRESKAHA